MLTLTLTYISVGLVKEKSVLGIPRTDFFNLAFQLKLMNEKFPSSEKLKSKTLIDTLFSEGKSIKVYPVKLIYLPIKNSEITTCKTGVSVPKRIFKNAVDRNYLKRLMREGFRKNKYLVESNLSLKYALMFVYIGRKKADFINISECMISLMKKLKDQETSHEKETL